jgi:flavoprotein
MEAHVIAGIIANSFVANASLLGFAALYPTYVMPTFHL